MAARSLLESFDPDATRQLLAANVGSSPKRASPTKGRRPFHEEIGRYLVQRQLGEGAFGKVYLAIDESAGELVAIKVLQRRSPRAGGAVDQYLEEVSVVGKLTHPNIVPVFDAGRTENGDCYIVSKFIEGVDLDALSSGGELSLEESVRIVAMIAEALDYAHRRDIIHRDIKPANILLDLDMTPYIIDFGVATEGVHAIHTGQRIAGTPFYMSPEQIDCSSYLLDGRSDTFSLGVVLYELMTGALPFQAGTMEALKKQVTEASPAPPVQLNPAIPDRLERICLRALEKSPADRYETAGQLASALVDWLERPDDSFQIGDGRVRVTSGSTYLMSCPQCGFIIPPGSHCAVCEWSENAEGTGERGEVIARAFAARRRVHLRNLTISMALQLATGLGGLMTLGMWGVMMVVGPIIGIVLLGAMTAGAASLALLTAGVRKLLPVDLKCPACEVRLDELTFVDDHCPYCDSRLR